MSNVSAAATGAEFLTEARAADHLGYVRAGQTVLGVALPSSLELADAALAVSTLTDDEKLLAWRIKLRGLDATRDEAAWDAQVAALPASVSNLNAAEWSRLRELWRISHLCAQFKWTEADAALTTFGDGSDLAGTARADFELAKFQTATRIDPGNIEHYVDFADALAAWSAWGLGADDIDPFLAYADMRGLDPEHRKFGRVTASLRAAGSADVCHRRFAELTWLGFLNRVRTFDVIVSGEDQIAADLRDAKVDLLRSDPAQVASASGGLGELLAHTLRLWDLYHGRSIRDVMNSRGPVDLLAYLDAAPASIAGVDDRIWAAHRLGWRVMASRAGLHRGNTLPLAQALGGDIDLLPPRLLALVEQALNVGLTRNLDELHYFVARVIEASYVETALPTPREEAAQAVAGIGGFDPGDAGAADQVEAMFASLSGQPGRLADCAMTTIRESLHALVRERDEARRGNMRAVLDQCVGAGARSLDSLEVCRDPGQVHLRRLMIPLLAEAEAAVNGSASAQSILEQRGSSVRGNSALMAHVDVSTLVDLPEPTIAAFAARTEFSRLVDLHGEEVRDQAPALIAVLTSADLAAALASIPEDLDDRESVAVARAIRDESFSRGAAELGLAGGAWKLALVQRAELRLGGADTFDDALADLTALATEEVDPTDPDAVSARDRAVLIVDALSSMSTLEAFEWGADWLRRIRLGPQQNILEMRYLEEALALPMAAAYTRPDVQAFYTDPAVDPQLRNGQRLMLAEALVASGRPEAAIPILEDIMADTALPAGHYVTQYAASWWLQGHRSIAESATDPATHDDACNQMIGFVRTRLPTLAGQVMPRRELARFGVWAAKRIEDAGAIAEFAPIAAGQV